MKKEFTAILLSGLVFPGFGQIFLGRKGLGIGLILATNAGIACLVFSIMRRIPLILQAMQPELERGALDLKQIVDLSLRHASLGGGSWLETVGMTIVGLCWILAVGHALRAGKSYKCDAGCREGNGAILD